MKKLSRIVLSLILIIPMLIGMFSTLDLFGNNLSLDSSSSLTTPLGEGQNPLIDNIVPDSPQINDDKDEVQPVSETTEFVKKSYEEYFTDNNISSDVSTTTITGTGKKDNPYQINSTNDFYFMSKYLDILNGKYIEVNCDIILNDETFDIDGNPTSGDGKYYEWKPMENCAYSSFNFKNHIIKGLYINQPETDYVGLFGRINLTELKNVIFENTYLKGYNYVAPVSHILTTYASNCVMRSGNIFGYSNVAGLFWRGLTGGIIQNCVNYVDVSTTEVNNSASAGAAGIVVVSSRLYISNCQNFGDISAGSRVAGIVAQGGFSDMNNCANYGNIKGDTNGGGIVGIIDDSVSNIKHCTNYGEIDVDVWTGGIAGVSYAKTLDFYDCKNYGTVYCTQHNYVGELLGRLEPSGDTKETSHNFINCEINSKSGGVIICYMPPYASTNYDFNINFKNIRVNYENCEFTPTYLLIGILGRPKLKNINVDGMHVKIKHKKFDLKLIENSTKRKFNLNVKNFLLEAEAEQITTSRFISDYEKSLSINISSGIWDIKSSDDHIKTYKGSDFKGFYISWKTGKIGLSQIDGTGFFQDVVSPKKLRSLGYSGESGDLESQYTLLEYIESTGSQYIDSGVKFSPTLKIETKYELTKTTDTRNYVFGLVEKNNSRVQWSHSPESFAGFNTTYEKFAMTCETGKEYNLHMDSGKFILDGTVVSDQSGQAAGVVSSETIRICAAHIDGAITHFSNLKLYSFNIADGENLIRSFVPAKRNADGAVGLYDRVEGKFYENKGTGSFVAGNLAI